MTKNKIAINLDLAILPTTILPTTIVTTTTTFTTTALTTKCCYFHYKCQPLARGYLNVHETSANIDCSARSIN